MPPIDVPTRWQKAVSRMDSYERLQPSDMMKNATITASFAFLAANRDERLPRKPAPQAAAGRGTGQ